MVKIVGEIGINHNGDINKAKALIYIAKSAGFDYVKFQKRNENFQCVNENQKKQFRNTEWGTIPYIEYRKRLEFNQEQYDEIDKYCKSINMKWFASVWDIESVDFMKKYTNIGKIPSPMLNNLNLIKYARENFDFLIVSNGMSNQEEIDNIINNYKPNVVMSCVSSYPTKLQDINLHDITYLKNNHKITIGYSGHEITLSTAFAAVALGAELIERHITLDRNMWGSDQKFSLNPIAMSELVKGIREIEQSLGTIKKRELKNCEKTKLKELKNAN